jgi:hypothetical protein
LSMSAPTVEYTSDFLAEDIFLVGDQVLVRNQSSDTWQLGTVVSLLPLQVTVEGSSLPSVFAIVEKVSEAQFSVGDRVQVRNHSSEPWHLGEAGAATAQLLAGTPSAGPLVPW